MCKVPVATLPIRGTEQKPAREGEDRGWKARTRVAPAVVVAGEVCSGQTLQVMLGNQEP